MIESNASEEPHRPSRVLRVFFDWGHVWPLWENGSDKYAMEPTDYNYSAALTEALHLWQKAWVPIANFDMGETDDLPSSQAYELYEDLARRALAGILAETPSDIAVSIEQHDAPRPEVNGFKSRRRPSIS